MTDDDDHNQPPWSGWRHSWALVTVLIVAMLLLCTALVLAAVIRG